MSLPFAGGGGAASDVGVWLLAGTWVWGGLGAAAFGVKRLYEREAALARLARRRGSRPAARWLVPVLTSAAAVAIVAWLLRLQAQPDLIATTVLLVAVGALFVSSGFPRGVRSRRGRVLLLVGAFALAASWAPFAAYWAGAFVDRVTWDPGEPARLRQIAQWLGLVASYTLLGAWLLFLRPFADHEWRLARSSERGLN